MKRLYDPGGYNYRHLPYAQRDLGGVLGAPLGIALLLMIVSPAVCLILLWKLGVYLFKYVSAMKAAQPK